MKCIFCGGETVNRKVDEEIRYKTNHVLVKVDAEVCNNCHEKYYNSDTMDRLLRIKTNLGKQKDRMKQIGKVFKYAL
jgi:YgiT-type zinc finger domain-containing protein